MQCRSAGQADTVPGYDELVQRFAGLAGEARQLQAARKKSRWQLDWLLESAKASQKNKDQTVMATVIVTVTKGICLDSHGKCGPKASFHTFTRSATHSFLGCWDRPLLYNVSGSSCCLFISVGQKAPSSDHLHCFAYIHRNVVCLQSNAWGLMLSNFKSVLKTCLLPAVREPA